MMDVRSREGQALMAGYVIVLLMVLALAFRTEQTIAAVLKEPPVSRAVEKTESPSTRVFGEIQRRYEQLARALPALRDPFNDPPPPPRAQQAASTRQSTPARAPEPAAPVFPFVRAIIYDQLNPSVQLSVDGELSGWLHQGGTFRGWSIAQITPESVRVARDGASFQLRVY